MADRSSLSPQAPLLNAQAFRVLVEQSPIGAFTLVDGRITYANDRLAQILGIPSTTLLNSSLPDLVMPEDRQLVNEHLGRLHREQDETQFLARAQKKSGLRVFLEVYAARTEMDGHSAVVGTVLDVSDRELSVEHLNEQLEFVSAITSNLGEGLCAFDENGLVTFANQASEEILKWMQYELIAKSLHDFIHPNEERLDCPLRNPARRLVGIDDEFQRRDGTLVPVSYTLSPAQGSGGGVIVFHDITERKTAEESLRQSEQDYRGLFENARDAILLVDAVTEVVLEVNQRASDLYGYSREEFVGTPLRDISNDRSFAQLNLKEVVRNQGSLQFEILQVRKDGTEINVEVNANFVSYKGNPAILSINRDISERKRSEAEQTRLQSAIRKAALEWQTTFDSIESSIVIVGIDGKILRLNRAARDLAGKDYREILGRMVDQVAPVEPWQTSAQQIRLAGESEPMKFCQVVDGLTLKTWDVSVTRFGGRGIDEERYILIMRDVTEVVKMQESLSRSERMSAMGSLVAGVAHEVRNPLFGMSATLDAFEASFGNTGYTEYITQFRDQIDRLNGLMRGLLDYGKPATAELVPGGIQNVIEAAAHEARQSYPEHSVEVALGDLPDMLLDRSRMFQVFENLIKNAFQHTEPGGTVRVEGHSLEEGNDRWIEIAVLDRGSGFAPEDLAKVFEPFFTRRRGGTGLGLSIVQKILMEHGGTITAGNRQGGGASMLIRVPALARN